jgi:hypothetical protein
MKESIGITMGHVNWDQQNPTTLSVDVQVMWSCIGTHEELCKKRVSAHGANTFISIRP